FFNPEKDPFVVSKLKNSAMTPAGELDAAVDRDCFADTLESPRKFGAELELTIVDKKNSDPMPIAKDVIAKLPTDIREQFHLEHLWTDIEIVTKPHVSVSSFRDELEHLLGQLHNVLDQRGASLLWSGTHPNLGYQRQPHSTNIRNQHNVRRLADPSGLATKGLHFHFEASKNEAVPIINNIQTFFPLLVALSANSPVIEGNDTGFRSKRVSTWSSCMGVCGLTGPFDGWDDFESQIRDLKNAKRIDSMKDNYAFVRPTRFGTIEIRCCDTPMNVNQVISLLAVTRTLVEAICDGQFDNLKRRRDFLRAELHEAAQHGPEARLTNHRNELVSPQQWLDRLVYDIQPTAMTIGTDLAIRLAPQYLATNGSTEQLARYRRLLRNRQNEAVVTIPANRGRSDNWEIDWITAATSSAVTAALLMLLARIII
ncbi:MAG: glutamate-cysteine ligase family protein, partial [Planctomycetota bacterium]